MTPGLRKRHYSRMTFRPGDQVEYIGQTVFDHSIRTGDLGIEDDWVFAEWPDSGEHSVPLRKREPSRHFPNRGGDQTRAQPRRPWPSWSPRSQQGLCCIDCRLTFERVAAAATRSWPRSSMARSHAFI